MKQNRIGVIGGGAWVTALAHLAATAGAESLLWARDTDAIDAINNNKQNSRYLKGIPLDPELRATSDLSKVCQSDAILLVVPAQAVRGLAHQIASLVPKGVPIICCAKGLEIGTGHLMSEVIKEILPHNPRGCLSGPTFATEAARGIPTAVTLAMQDPDLGAKLARAISTPSFRPYVSDDVVGAEVGGAVKNVLAIACGISTGIGMGENSRAALITRGLAEAIRLATTLGGQAETLSGLAGLGDLAMTCGSRQSRNFRFGEALGQGARLETVPKEMGGVVEGRHTAQALAKRAGELRIDLPICQAVDIVLNHGADLRTTVDSLMRRPLRMETDR